MLEAADVEGLTRLLTRKLPSVLGVEEATLLLWDRKLDTFEGLTPDQTQAHPVWPGGPEVAAPQARYLVVEGALVETPQKEGDGTLLPLLARSGLAGMLALGRRRGRRNREPFRPAEVRWLSVIASRAALALENSFYLKELVATERVAALGTMASMLAHDFRGPMTVIRGYAETLLDPSVPPDEVRARAALIVSNVDRLERMTAETLDFARGGGRLSRRPVLLERVPPGPVRRPRPGAAGARGGAAPGRAGDRARAASTWTRCGARPPTSRPTPATSCGAGAGCTCTPRSRTACSTWCWPTRARGCPTR